MSTKRISHARAFVCAELYGAVKLLFSAKAQPVRSLSTLFAERMQRLWDGEAELAKVDFVDIERIAEVIRQTKGKRREVKPIGSNAKAKKYAAAKAAEARGLPPPKAKPSGKRKG